MQIVHLQPETRFQNLLHQSEDHFQINFQLLRLMGHFHFLHRFEAQFQICFHLQLMGQLLQCHQLHQLHQCHQELLHHYFIHHLKEMFLPFHFLSLPEFLVIGSLLHFALHPLIYLANQFLRYLMVSYLFNLLLHLQAVSLEFVAAPIVLH